MYPGIHVFMYPCIHVSMYPCILVSMYQDIQESRYLDIQVSRYPVIQLSASCVHVSRYTGCMVRIKKDERKQAADKITARRQFSDLVFNQNYIFIFIVEEI